MLYAEAFYADGSQILGNLDGQTSWPSTVSFRRTKRYKQLVYGEGRPAYERVFCWQICYYSSGHSGTRKLVETVINPRRAL